MENASGKLLLATAPASCSAVSVLYHAEVVPKSTHIDYLSLVFYTTLRLSLFIELVMNGKSYGPGLFPEQGRRMGGDYMRANVNGALAPEWSSKRPQASG